ncbi:hypothetical protein [Microbispora sp. NBRC 16548]|uniref:hypothetical protein n=1 Tax=Microbispora sp. NBRC 16548 TaxID=3030994 RepID=UPI0024A42604|nr:hypothetical protein [Microbispora sp. NBRC 16548]GLX03917.1 hypothetical protein Misp03_08440 [Microbispora sp. NBRC 16548]
MAKPVFWSAHGGCAERGLDDRRLGLDLKVLRDAATDGHVYGFVVNWMTKEDLLGLLGKPDVRNVSIVEAVPHPDRVPH